MKNTILKVLSPCFMLILLIVFMASAEAAPKCDVEKFDQYQMQYCLYEGDGPLLVLEGSQGNDMTIWPDSFIQKLNQLGAVLTYNRIGYQQSYYFKRKAMQSVTAKNVVKHLHALLHRLKINKPVVMVAHSIGGIYAQYFVRNYPGHVKALVMIDADSSFEPKVNSPFQSKSPDKKGTVGYLESMGFNRSMDQVNHLPPFPNIPLLVISATNHGSSKETEELWQQLQKKMVKQSPQGKQVIAHGSGHFVFKDEPDFVISAIEDMILKSPCLNSCKPSLKNIFPLPVPLL